MNAWLLLSLVTILYAGYNLFAKVSGGHVSGIATTTVLATITVQLVALATSTIFSVFLLLRGGQVFSLPSASYGWAALAGLCIGGAEIGYFYLFSGIGSRQAMEANVVIPVVVCGTVFIAVLASFLFFREHLGSYQLLGAGLLSAGIICMFAGR
ncbi:MAG: hypothetical protein AB7F09_16200 [Parvibaculaceae bacterium]